ncbi:DUF4809 family protein [Vagococcus fessus]|uniref:DUF4809 domain-containing protein n=1 Tax=Vagococcus fessus TaxID=120370 RepID=A0A430A8E0_9ENTE|nr:DUF4809 family protein [Vagococcus fessus]RSU03378.1 hypothetical protein CBF31_06605 [Vagococcus fessus]
MKEVAITSTIDLTNGGCNACGTVESVIFSLDLDGKEIVLDGLTVSSMVMGLVLNEGWSQEYKVMMMDEYTVFSKNGKEVKLVEEYDQLIYSSAGKSISSKNFISDNDELFSKVNGILQELFQSDGYTFTM